MDQSRVTSVRGEEFSELQVERSVAFLRFIFVDQVIPPVNARDERAAVVFGKGASEVQAEYGGEALAVAPRRLRAEFQYENAVDVRGVLDEKLEVALAGAHQLDVAA